LKNDKLSPNEIHYEVNEKGVQMASTVQPKGWVLISYDARDILKALWIKETPKIFYHFLGKDLTFSIEASNSDIRHRLGRFTRRTKASSRSFYMIHASLKITHHLQDDSVLKAYLSPLISSFS
jgi:hypothetical protein